jgi:hypothetical protein
MSGSVSIVDVLTYVQETQDLLEGLKAQVPGSLVDEIEANLRHSNQLLVGAGWADDDVLDVDYKQ